MMYGVSLAATLLMALGIGYIVLCLAGKENQPLKIIGYVTGFFIVLISIIFIFNTVIFSLKLQRNMKNMTFQDHPAVKIPVK